MISTVETLLNKGCNMSNLMRRYVENCFSYGAVKWDGTNTEEIMKYMNASGGDIWEYAIAETNRGNIPFTHYISEDGDLVITQKVAEDRTYALKIVPNGYLMQAGGGAFATYGEGFEEDFMELKKEWQL